MIISMFLPSLDCCLIHAREADFIVALIELPTVSLKSPLAQGRKAHYRVSVREIITNGP